jgi:hypothetical protein
LLLCCAVLWGWAEVAGGGVKHACCKQCNTASDGNGCDNRARAVGCNWVALVKAMRRLGLSLCLSVVSFEKLRIHILSFHARQ